MSGGSSGEGGAGASDARGGSSAEAGSPAEPVGAGGEPGNGGSSNSAAGEGGASSSADGGASGERPTSGASGTGGSGGGGGSGGSVPVDTVPPTILSITPVNGATKLTPMTDIIVVTFSEPMNQASAQAAFVPSGAAPVPTFSWNAAGTVLTINPKLTYPTATDPAAAATPYKFSISTLAKDLAGNALAASVNWQFSLLREITQSFRYSGGGNVVDGNARTLTYAGAGDTTSDLADRGFLSYDISALPVGIAVFESATISTRIAGIVGDPFGLFGNLLIQSVAYASLDQAAFDAPPLHDLGVFVPATGTNAAGDAVTKDVLVALKDDYANRSARNNVSQYKLLFPGSPNANGITDFAYVVTNGTGNVLVIKYLFP